MTGKGLMAQSDSTHQTMQSNISIDSGTILVDKRREENSKNKSTDCRQEIIYADENSVILEEIATGNRRFERREQFENALGSRWQLEQENTTNAKEENPSPAEENYRSDASQVDIDSIRRSISHLQQYANDETPYGSVVESLLSAYLHLLSEDKFERPDFKEIDGIGPQTEQNLRDSEIETQFDVALVPEQSLTDIEGIGQKTAERLKQQFGSLDDTLNQ